VHCLTATSPDTLSQLNEGLERGFACGGFVCEVTAGAPFSHYGARLTLRHDLPGALGRAFGFDDHPWGPPRLVGLRIRPGGQLRAKPYHAVDRLDERFELPAEWPRDLYPIWASLDGDVVELYLGKRDACEFGEFAARCLAPLGAAPPETAPAPRARSNVFGVGVRRERGRLTAISVYAGWRSLPRDAEIERQWSAGLDEPDRRAYELTVAGVRSTGFLPTGNWHDLLWWTTEADGRRHRAVSLKIAAR
jgi:hypothetical protein